MENRQADDEVEESYLDTVKDYVLLPFIRGVSFGMAHVLAFAVIGPLISRKLKLS